MKRVILAFCVLHAATAAHAGSLKDAKWNALIAEAVKHGGVETISGNTGSYVFSRPDGMDMTFTRSLDNKIRLICIAYMSKNINVCMNWNDEKVTYSTRASETAPWVISSTRQPRQRGIRIRGSTGRGYSNLAAACETSRAGGGTISGPATAAIGIDDRRRTGRSRRRSILYQMRMRREDLWSAPHLTVEGTNT